MKAFVYANGVIRFGARCGNGSVELAKTVSDSKRARAKFRSTLEVCARHGYKPGILLVPGVPEAKNQDDGLEALASFKKQLKTHFALEQNPVGVVTA